MRRAGPARPLGAPGGGLGAPMGSGVQRLASGMQRSRSTRQNNGFGGAVDPLGYVGRRLWRFWPLESPPWVEGFIQQWNPGAAPACIVCRRRAIACLQGAGHVTVRWQGIRMYGQTAHPGVPAAAQPCQRRAEPKGGAGPSAGRAAAHASVPPAGTADDDGYVIVYDPNTRESTEEVFHFATAVEVRCRDRRSGVLGGLPQRRPRQRRPAWRKTGRQGARVVGERPLGCCACCAVPLQRAGVLGLVARAGC